MAQMIHIRGYGREVEMKRIIFGIVYLLPGVAVVASLAVAAVPRTISYQGYLKDTISKPLPGPVTLGFALYSSTRSNSGALWNETQTKVPLTNGVYSVTLGNNPAQPLTLPFDVPYYLGVSVGTDPELIPRQPLTSAPYALSAVAVEGQTLANLDSRYVSPVEPLRPTPQQVATLRWDQVGGSSGVFPVGNGPTSLAFDGTNIWVANADSDTVQKINPATGSVSSPFPAGANPIALAFDGANLWVANFLSNLVQRIDPATGIITASVQVGNNPIALAFDGANLWVANYSGNSIQKIAAAANPPVASAPIAVGKNPVALVFDGSTVWVANSGDATVQYLATPNTISAPIAVSPGSSALAFDGANIWVASFNTSSLQKINRAVNPPVAASPIAVGNKPIALAYDGADLWLANYLGASVQKIDPITGAVGALITVGVLPRALVFDGESIWVANNGSNSISKIPAVSALPGVQQDTAQIADGAVTTPKLAVGAVTDLALANGAVTGVKLATGAVSATALGPDAVTTPAIANGAVTGAKIAMPLYLDGTLQISGNLQLPATTATTGVIRQGSATLLHTAGANSFFAGAAAGNLMNTGNHNTATGTGALQVISTGAHNTAYGANALQNSATGYANTALGMNALQGNVFGNYNTSVGAETLTTNNAGGVNVAVGYQALSGNTDGDGNTAVGAHALESNSLGADNTAVGYKAGVTQNYANANMTGSRTTFIGVNSGPGTAAQLTNAAAIGYNAQVSQDNSLVLGATGADAVKVGIGTSNPLATLHVESATGTNANVLLKAGGAATGFNIGISSTPTFYIAQSNGVTYADRFILDATGKIKIPGVLEVVGGLIKPSGSFKIDHPLEPREKYLYHSFVESPDMMNIYNGNVITDFHGYATVELPDWFEGLNREFRYQLTVIGAGDTWARARVYRELEGNRFVIQTDVPQTKVSWQITGIRKDAWAEAHRIPVEEVKPAAEQGTCLHAEACR